MPDDELARRLGRPKNAVRLKRTRLGIPNALDRRPTWTEADDMAVRKLPPKEAVARTGRTLSAVYGRRHVLVVPDSCPV